MNNLILLIKIISFITVSFYILLLWLPVFLTLRPTYKYYKVTYDVIKSKEYVLSSNDRDFISFLPKSKELTRKRNYFFIPSLDDEILYFKDTEGIKLIKGYIHKNDFFWFDPYTVYWYKKIKTQIMINSSVENMREYKLRQLKIK